MSEDRDHNHFQAGGRQNYAGLCIMPESVAIGLFFWMPTRFAAFLTVLFNEAKWRLWRLRDRRTRHVNKVIL
jgi:hypothetical protein